MTDTERTLRRELAACCRLFDWMGWTELIFNHITVRVPGTEGARAEYLINPFGLHYAEVTADNLLKIDIEGCAVACKEHELRHDNFHGAMLRRAQIDPARL